MKSSILLNLDFQTIETNFFFHHISAFPSQQSCVCNVLFFVFLGFFFLILFNFLLGYGYSHFFP